MPAVSSCHIHLNAVFFRTRSLFASLERSKLTADWHETACRHIRVFTQGNTNNMYSIYTRQYQQHIQYLHKTTSQHAQYLHKTTPTTCTVFIQDNTNNMHSIYTRQHQQHAQYLQKTTPTTRKVFTQDNTNNMHSIIIYNITIKTP